MTMDKIKEVTQKNKIYKYESYYSENEIKKNSQLFNNQWSNKNFFIMKLKLVETYLNDNNNSQKNNISFTCPFPLCNHNFNNGENIYRIKNIFWKESLLHLIANHGYIPSDNFIDIIFTFKIPLKNKSKIKIGRSLNKNNILKKNGLTFIKLESNQMNILDSLMEHGGGTRKYKLGKKNINSEHAGLLDFDSNLLSNVIVFADTNYVDQYDEDIYLPNNNEMAFDYEYMFHTHPPTPKPGGRAISGFLYEFPSTSDILHFIEHYNQGVTQGSIVIAPEGMYLIRKHILDGKKIKINEDDFFEIITRLIINTNKIAITKYGTKFDNKKFYNKIARDINHIDKINKTLFLYGITIDYFPRSNGGTDINPVWILKDIYIPVYPVE